MDILNLDVQTRDTNVKANNLRYENLIPAVFYGTNKENQNLSMDYQTFRKTFEKAGGNTVIELNIDGKNKINVLVHDVQYDPVTDKYTHVDFVFVDLDKEVITDIPLVAVGESKAVRELAGTLMQNRDMLTVRCIARNLPKVIEFDISVLEDFHSSIHISDLNLPEGVEAVDEDSLTIATVVAPKAEEEPEEVEGEEGEEGAEGAEGEGAAEGEAKEGGEDKGGAKEGGDKEGKEKSE